MNIVTVTDNYYLWEDRKQYVLTTRKRLEIFRGSRTECERVMNRYPNGMTRREAELFNKVYTDHNGTWRVVGLKNDTVTVVDANIQLIGLGDEHAVPLTEVEQYIERR